MFLIRKVLQLLLVQIKAFSNQERQWKKSNIVIWGKYCHPRTLHAAKLTEQDKKPNCFFLKGGKKRQKEQLTHALLKNNVQNLMSCFGKICILSCTDKITKCKNCIDYYLHPPMDRLWKKATTSLLLMIYNSDVLDSVVGEERLSL